MIIPLERQSPKAVYLQIRDRISRLIRSGSLQPGDKLPSIRHLAQNIQVNKLTVIEAYSVLEADGLIEARQGSGYYVSQQDISRPQAVTNFDPPQKVFISQPSTPLISTLNPSESDTFLNKWMTSLSARDKPGMIDFSVGFMFASDLDDLQKIARRAMKQIDTNLFNYDFPQGQLTLRQQISRFLVQRGLDVTPDNLIITNGSQQALYLAISHYVKPGDWVIVESPTYHGALAVLADRGARSIGIPMTATGMNLELLEKYLNTHHPKLIYTVSTLHNPTGVTTPQTHRQQLLKLAEQYNCIILEDNAYEGLNFETVPAPIKALDRQDLVTYIGTFSKTLMPGMRVGYMVATGKHYNPLVERQLLSDLHVSTVSQAIVSEYLASGHYRHHINRIRNYLLQGRNAMLNALEKYFPPSTSWTVPQGGLFLWVSLPTNLPLGSISQKAFNQNVLVASGTAFFPQEQGYPALRLSFTHSPEEIERGIALLGKIINQEN